MTTEAHKMPDFPIVDLSAFANASAAEKQSLGRRVDEICRRTGFLAITGHGVPEEVITRAWNSARVFFDLPVEKKLAVKMRYEGYPYGYSPLQSEALAKSKGEETPPDIKESFNIGPLTVPPHTGNEPYAAFRYATNVWPAEPAEFEQAWPDYYRALGALAVKIMRVFAVALNLPENFFDASINDPISAVRALNYPHQDATPKPGQLRAGAHSDYGSLTILRADSAAGGLEIFNPQKQWQPVPAVPNGFVVNIGDLMARWTNDRWVSTLHRVVNPPPDANGSTRRQSVAFFQQPNWDAEITCIPTCLAPGERPKYPPVRSGEYLMQKFHSTVKLTAANVK
jgi:isopenicillin N synthase-like dioxygenase